MMKSGQLFAKINALTQTYRNELRLVTEEDNKTPFPSGDDEDDSNAASAAEAAELPDPTETAVTDAAAQANNNQGAYVSDIKLAMLANLLLRAYMATPEGAIPPQFSEITDQNANEFIQYIETVLDANKASDDIKSQLEQM